MTFFAKSEALLNKTKVFKLFEICIQDYQIDVKNYVKNPAENRVFAWTMGLYIVAHALN